MLTGNLIELVQFYRASGNLYHCVLLRIDCLARAKILKRFAQMLKANGIFVYGDLTIHVSDNQRFFQKLERTLSAAHAKYYKSSEMQLLMKAQGFRISKVRTITYTRTYQALMEDKGEYFGVTPKTIQKCIQEANAQTRNQYELNSSELTQYYAMITAFRENRDGVEP